MFLIAPHLKVKFLKLIIIIIQKINLYIIGTRCSKSSNNATVMYFGIVQTAVFRVLSSA